MQQKRRYDVARMLREVERRGWLPIDLIRRAKPPISLNHGYRFLRGESQSPRTAKKLSEALGHDPDEFLIGRPKGRVA